MNARANPMNLEAPIWRMGGWNCVSNPPMKEKAQIVRGDTCDVTVG